MSNAIKPLWNNLPHSRVLQSQPHEQTHVRPTARPALRAIEMETDMKGILAWVIGIPIPIIILLYLFDFF